MNSLYELLPLAIIFSVVQLNFPEYRFQIKSQNNKNLIFDPIRKKYIVLTPEEWVRQHVIKQLLENGFPAGRISVERTLSPSKKRYDLVFFNETGNAQLLVECKAPKVALNQKTINQVSNYISLQNVPNVLLTNGLTHFHFARKLEGLQIVQEFPHFSTLSN